MSPTTNPKKVLFVEDDHTLIGILSDKFKSEGFQVLQALDGASGLKIAFSEKPDLILLDIVMMGMGGVAMLKKLREDAWGKNVPVIILTNLTNPYLKDDAEKAGISYFLIKTDTPISEVLQISKGLLEKA